MLFVQFLPFCNRRSNFNANFSLLFRPNFIQVRISEKFNYKVWKQIQLWLKPNAYKLFTSFKLAKLYGNLVYCCVYCFFLLRLLLEGNKCQCKVNLKALFTAFFFSILAKCWKYVGGGSHSRVLQSLWNVMMAQVLSQRIGSTTNSSKSSANSAQS